MSLFFFIDSLIEAVTLEQSYRMFRKVTVATVTL